MIWGFSSCFQSLDGDIIDCVLISTQPALDHPKLKRHRIKLQPPPLPASLKQGQGSRRSADASTTSSASNVWATLNMMPVQLWHHQREQCPSGTIPVRRTKEEDLLRAANVSQYGRKPHRPVAPPISVGIRDSGHSNATTHTNVHQVRHPSDPSS